jgi:NAD(P)-dependent dehydrogenase (short-subunit alcohol dehydrogenase family)
MGKVALITRAARGLGRETAMLLAKRGVNVAIPDVLFEQAKATSEEIKALGRKSIALKMDVSDYAQVEEGFSRVVAELGPIDILVNSQGTVHLQAITEFNTDAWQKVIDVNLKGTFLCAQEVAKSMIREGKGGKIINIASKDGINPGGNAAASYVASKGGVIMLTKALALEEILAGITTFMTMAYIIFVNRG